MNDGGEKIPIVDEKVHIFDCNKIPKKRYEKMMSDLTLFLLMKQDEDRHPTYSDIKEALVPALMTRDEFECAFDYMDDMGFIYRTAGALDIKGRAGFYWRINGIYIPAIRDEIKKKGIKWVVVKRSSSTLSERILSKFGSEKKQKNTD